jgi:hypothetical protein
MTMATKRPAAKKAALGGTRIRKPVRGSRKVRGPAAPAAVKPAAVKPAATNPTGKKTSAKTSVAKRSATKRSATKRPATKKSAAKKSAAKKSAAKKSAAKKSAAKKSAAKKSAAKKSAAKRPVAKSPAAKRNGPRIVRAAAAASSGPVTLEQAQALAQALRPRRALTQAATPPPSPAPIGQARQRVEVRRSDERRRRIDEYVATLRIMKQRGGRRRGAAAPAFRPLQVMAEGDSWFDYPYPAFGGGIVKRLQKRLGVPILNLAEAGDEVRFMLGVKQRARLVQSLREGCPAGGPWDAVLFSGGGNDIVDNPMALWVKDWNPGTAPADHLHQPRFDIALGLVRAGYEDLIALRDALSPDTQLVFHGYDFALPDGRGACHLGPWLKPTFDLRGFPTQAAGAAVVRRMLEQFAAMLDSLTANPRVTVVATQGTLAPKASSWHNELHPAKTGFDTFAELFRRELARLFPDRVA